jgi:dynein heavy chain
MFSVELLLPMLCFICAMLMCCVQVESELRKLAQVYAVYAEHAEAVRQYSNMLWSELDIGNMMDGVQAVATKLKKLNGLEDMPVFGLVQAEIAGFADSLPLMKELKSEALRCGAVDVFSQLAA